MNLLGLKHWSGERDKKVLAPYNRPFYYPFVAESGEGCIVRDVDINEYIDFNSGAGSVEAAIKVVKWHTRRPYLLAFIGAFHGRTMGAVSLTASKPIQKKYFFPMMPGVVHVPYPYCYRCVFNLTYPDCNFYCVDYIEDMVLKRFVPPEETAAIVFEPIQGEGNYVVPLPNYFERLKKLADKYGILLVADEVQSGMGRTGKWFAIEHWNVEPDVLCMAKGIASGLSLGSVMTRAEIMDWEPDAHCTTFGANPVACAAAMAVIDVIKEKNLLENATKQGEHAIKRLKELQEDSEMIGDVRGKGLMVGVEIVRNKDTKEPAEEESHEIIKKCWKKGLVIITAGDSTIRIAPMLIITQELLDTGLDILESCIREVEKEMR